MTRTRGQRAQGSRAVAVLLFAILLVLLLIVVVGSPLARLRPATAAEILEKVPATSLTRALLELPTAEGDTPAYSRDEFGLSWADVDGNGCDTRNDILARDLQNSSADPKDPCVVLAGTLDDPYTGSVIDFRRGKKTSSLVQIDHVVALANAWRSGAWKWDAQRRLEFANDPLVLLAVDGSANQEKSASSADQWLPENRAFRCQYAGRQIAIKDRWELGVTEAERSSLARVVAQCAPQELPRE